MDEITVFENPEFGKVRVVSHGNDPWFVLKDVCVALGIENYRNVASRLDDDEKDVHQVDTLGGMQNMTIITESGLYNVILRSDKPEAKRFKRWITHEVLPSIRKHGVYATDEFTEKAIADPDFAIKVFTALKEEREKVAQLKAEAEENRPAMLTGKAIASSTNGILIGQYAPRLREAGWDIGTNRLFEELRNDRFLCSQKGQLRNKPTQFCLKNEYMKYRTNIYTDSKGEQQTSYTPLITGKGQIYFLNYYKKKYGF